MKKTYLAILAFLVVAAPGAAQDNDGYYPYSFARLNYVSGDVFVQRASDLGYEKGELNLALVQGDKIGTEVGQAEVHFGRQNFLRISQYTQVEFNLLPREGDDRIKLHLLDGSIYLRVSSLPNEKEIEIHTPDASFYLLEEGLFRVNVRSDRESEFLVLEGSAEAAGEEGSLLVRAQEKISAIDGRFLGEPAYFNSGIDEFGEWNETRDSLLAERSNTRYLPSDLSEYEDELGRSGTWIYERPYGYVWTPYAINADWRPYLYGRWVWYPVIGWNWVSFEPWGWSVYHYGRWHWRIGLGWHWIPHHRWRPAWVHWWHHDSYVGWCPLSWYNRPVVIVNNHFYDRYDNANFPAGNRAMTVIRRNQLQSPNAARHVVAASELRSVGRISLKAEQPSIRPVANRSSAQTVQAQKVLSRTSARAAPKSYGPVSNPANSGRSISGENPSVIRRGTLGKTSGSTVESSGGVIRSFPSRQSASSSRPASGAADSRSSGVGKAIRSGAAPKSPSAGAASAKQASPAKSKSGSSGPVKQIKKESGSSGKAAQTEKKIKTYASSPGLASSSSSGRASGSSRAVNPGASSRTTSYPSRLQAPRSSSVTSPAGSSGKSSTSSRTQQNAIRSSPRTSSSSFTTSRTPKSSSSSKISRTGSPRSPSVSSRPAPSSPGRSSISRSPSSGSSAPRAMSAPRSPASRSGSSASSKSSSSSGPKSGAVKKKD